MGCGASTAVQPQRRQSQHLTQEQWLAVEAEAGIRDDYSDGAWYWGHANGNEKPPGLNQPRLQAVQAATAALPAYYRDIIRLKACPSYMDSMVKGKSLSGAVTCPFLGAKTYLDHAHVAKLLAECPHKHVQGSISRKNELGFLQLSDAAFKRTGTLSLGNPVEKHREQRRWLTWLLKRMPHRCGFLKEAHELLDGREKLQLPHDADIWWTQLLWRFVLRKKLTVEEAERFVTFKSNWLMAAVVAIEDFSIAQVTFTIGDLNRTQDEYWKQIELLLPAEVPGEVRGSVAQGVLEMFAFAGGISVPQTLHGAVAALYQDFMPKPVTLDNVEAFVYEVTRLWPAVQGFCYWEGKERVHLSLNAALRDPKAWGPDADKFTIKPLELYRAKHVGFVQQATGKESLDSRYCPGMQITLDVTQAFVLAMSTWAKEGSRVQSAWRPVGEIKPQGKPKWWRSFELERIKGSDAEFYEELLDHNYSGSALMSQLQPQELDALIQKVDQNRNGYPDAIKEMDFGARAFYELAKAVWKFGSGTKEVDEPYAPAASFTDDDSVVLSLGNIRMPTNDEQWAGMHLLERAAMAFIPPMHKLMNDDLPEQLYCVTPEDRLQTIAMGKQAFLNGQGSLYLPVCHDPWPDLMGDGAQWHIACYGLGQLYLKSSDDMALGELVCDPEADVLASLEVRPAFERLGARAFFKKGASGDFRITAVDWKHGGEVVTPDMGYTWERAKFAWRCSLITHVTAVYHLVHTHWIASNAFSTSLRENLDPDHPIRRLLHVNMYNSALINYSSFTSLHPEDAFLHRMSCLTYPGLTKAFEYALNKWEFLTWPQRIERMELPADIKAKLPMAQDGVALWSALRRFYERYVGLYYDSDADVQADAQLRAYWQFRCVPHYNKGLPPLSKDALVDQITQTVFDVTAFHELVGMVIGYVSDPAGGFLAVRKEQVMADKQNFLQSLSLTSSTGQPMPLFLSDWSYLLDLGEGSVFPNKFQEAKALWQDMHSELMQLSMYVRARNKERPQSFSAFDPQLLESSVSL